MQADIDAVAQRGQAIVGVAPARRFGHAANRGETLHLHQLHDSGVDLGVEGVIVGAQDDRFHAVRSSHSIGDLTGEGDGCEGWRNAHSLLRMNVNADTATSTMPARGRNP